MGQIQENIMEYNAQKATMKGMELKIEEAKTDYTKEIERLQEQLTARETVAASEIGRTRELGIAALTERGAQAAFESQKAMREVEQTASAAESRIGASGVRASGSALAAAQQDVDIAYAGAQRTAEAGEAAMKIGGLQLSGQLKGQAEQKTLLTLGYNQQITEQQRKLTELQGNAQQYLENIRLGGMAELTSSFYSPSTDVAKLMLAFL